MSFRANEYSKVLLLFKRVQLNVCHCVMQGKRCIYYKQQKTKVNRLYTGLQITVGHRTNVRTNVIGQMSGQNQILIGHNVRPNKIYCLMKKVCFIMLKEKLLFLTKKAVRFPFVIQSTG